MVNDGELNLLGIMIALKKGLKKGGRGGVNWGGKMFDEKQMLLVNVFSVN